MIDASSVQHGQITGRFAVATGDGPDADLLPDYVPASGTVTFTAVPKRLTAISAQPKPLTILPEPRVCGIDAEGDLCYPVPAPGVVTDKFVTLTATNSPSVNPVEFTYRVRFDLRSPSGKALSVPGFEIEVLAGETQDLAELVPVESSAGVQIIRGETGPAGDSVYDLWLAQGNVGDHATFLASMRGADSTVPGPAGRDGMDSTVPGPQGLPGADSTVPGPQGLTGPAGPAGEAAKINYVNATTLAPGSEATASITGENPYEIEFGIPAGERGEKGEPGAQGPAGPAGMEWKGVWDNTVDYVNSDSVFHNGTSWFAAGDPAVGEEPSNESVHWNPLALQGVAGPTGPAGPAGERGEAGLTGPAPTMQVGNVSTLPSGSQATVDMSGANPYSLNFGLPAGPAGERGEVGIQGLQGVPGVDGKSAYEIAVMNGFTGTEQEWLGSLEASDRDYVDQGDAETLSAAVDNTARAVADGPIGTYTTSMGTNVGSVSTYLTTATTNLTVRKKMRVSALSFYTAPTSGAVVTVLIDGEYFGEVPTSGSGVYKVNGTARTLAAGAHTVQIHTLSYGQVLRTRYQVVSSIEYKTKEADFTVSGLNEISGGYTPTWAFELLNGYRGKLGELDDVNFTGVGATTGQVLTFDSATGWKAATPASADTAAAVTESKNYADTQDAARLIEAKEYTDAQIATVSNTRSVKAGDTTTTAADSSSQYAGASQNLTVNKQMVLSGLSFHAVETGNYVLRIDGIEVAYATVSVAGTVTKFEGFSELLAVGDHSVSITAEAVKTVHYSTSPSINYIGADYDFSVDTWQEAAHIASYSLPLVYWLTVTTNGTLEDLDNVTDTPASDRQVLRFNGMTNSWEPSDSAVYLHELQDVDDAMGATRQNGDVLTYDVGLGQWIAAPPVAVGDSPSNDTDYAMGLIAHTSQNNPLVVQTIPISATAAILVSHQNYSNFGNSEYKPALGSASAIAPTVSALGATGGGVMMGYLTARQDGAYSVLYDLVVDGSLGSGAYFVVTVHVRAQSGTETLVYRTKKSSPSNPTPKNITVNLPWVPMVFGDQLVLRVGLYSTTLTTGPSIDNMYSMASIALVAPTPPVAPAP